MVSHILQVLQESLSDQECCSLTDTFWVFPTETCIHNLNTSPPTVQKIIKKGKKKEEVFEHMPFIHFYRIFHLTQLIRSLQRHYYCYL